MRFIAYFTSLLGLAILSRASPLPGKLGHNSPFPQGWKLLIGIVENHELSEREDADDAVAYAWLVGPSKAVKRAPEDANHKLPERDDADDAVAYAWVVGPPKAVKRAPEDADHQLSERDDADDAVAYAWVVGPSKAVKRTPDDADDAVTYAWVVGPPKIWGRPCSGAQMDLPHYLDSMTELEAKGESIGGTVQNAQYSYLI